MTREDQLLDLVAAVVDGTSLDWNEVDSRRLSEEERRFVRSLKVVAGVSDVHRSRALEASDTQDATGPVRRSEPLWWGRFELIAPLGEGAFGQVYRARDPLLNRTVAVKLLKPAVVSRETLVARVLSEGQALAAFDHPNIIRVYEAAVHGGRPGLCMEYVHGRTLQDQLDHDGPLSAHEAALIGQQICRALAEVHRKGLVHCDIKPRNVMRAQGGRVVVMDFGAGLGQDEALKESTPLMGTPLYLAPEILAGSSPSAQSDVYSVGVLLFQLVTGQFPVHAASLAALREAHRKGIRQNLNDLRNDLEDRFVQIVDRALTKEPASRFSSAGAMLSALTDLLGRSDSLPQPSPVPQPLPVPVPARAPSRAAIVVGALFLVAILGLVLWTRPTTSPGSAPGDASVRLAVLPLRNFTGDADWRVDAVTDELMATLGSLPGVRVSGWTSVTAVTKKSDASVSEVAKALGVEWILEGSVRRAANDPGQTVTTLSLLQASTGSPVWSTSLARSVDDLFLVARESAPAIAAKVGLAHAPGAVARSWHSQNSEARNAYLQARYLLRNETIANLREARSYLERAIALDPDYALAYSAFARCLIDLEIFGDVSRAEMEPLARGAIERAIAVEPTLSDPFTRLGDFKMYYEFDWEGAGAAYRKAIELNTYDITARQQYARYLAALGKVTQAIEQARVAEDVDPVGPATGTLAMVLYYARQYDDALAAFAIRRTATPGLAQVHFSIGRVLSAKGAFADAMRELQQAIQIDGATPNVLIEAELARTYAQSGDAREARSRLAELERAHPNPPPSLTAYFGYVEAALGDTDRAFALLESAVQKQAVVLMWAQVDPRLDPLRNDHRYRELLGRLRLVQ